MEKNKLKWKRQIKRKPTKKDVKSEDKCDGSRISISLHDLEINMAPKRLQIKLKRASVTQHLAIESADTEDMEC